jgi:hypothetical protein
MSKCRQEVGEDARDCVANVVEGLLKPRSVRKDIENSIASSQNLQMASGDSNAISSSTTYSFSSQNAYLCLFD